jgi:hypothetical protein
MNFAAFASPFRRGRATAVARSCAPASHGHTRVEVAITQVIQQEAEGALHRLLPRLILTEAEENAVRAAIARALLDGARHGIAALAAELDGRGVPLELSANLLSAIAEIDAQEARLA